MPSIWEKQSFPSLTDFVIIGAGITGLFTALFLKQKYPNASIRIVERGAHPIGASLRNAGFACFGSPSEILDDASSEGREKAISRLIRRYQGLVRLREALPANTGLWKANGGHEVFGKNDAMILEECLEILPDLNRRLKSEIGLEPYSISQNTSGMAVARPLIAIKGEASIHSGAVIMHLLKLVESQNVKIQFNTEVDDFERINDQVRLSCTQGPEIRCTQLILCTNAFTRELVDIDVWPNRGQVLLTEPIRGLKLRGNYHLNQGYFYFRDFEGGILLGGGRHLDRVNEQTASADTTKKIQNELENLLREIIIPQTEYSIKMRWAGTMAFGRNNEKEPLVRELEPGIFAAVRLGGMGIAMAPNVARELVDII